jgi:hypothetical protein
VITKIAGHRSLLFAFFASILILIHLILTLYVISDTSSNFRNKIVQYQETHADYTQLSRQITPHLRINDSKRTLFMNPSEEANYIMAMNSFYGFGLVEWSQTSRDYVSSSKNRMTQFLYLLVIKSGFDFDLFIIVLLLVFFLAYVMGIYLVLSISCLVMSKRMSEICAISWAAYPSNLLHIGTGFFYENLAVTALLYFTYVMLRHQQTYMAIRMIICVSLILVIVGSLRIQALFVALISIVITGFLTKDPLNKRNMGLVGFTTAILFVLVSIPTLVQNKKDFGEYSFGYQGHYMFWEGANKLARGSWDGTGLALSNAKSEILGFQEMDESELASELMKTSMTWIVHNPIDYSLLQLRKIAIFFFPTNFESGYFLFQSINPFNLSLHLGLLFVVVIYTLKSLRCRYFAKRMFLSISRENIILFLSPVAGSLLLTLTFFVGFRWRFYAEPFMLMAFYYLCSQFYFLNVWRFFRSL